MNIITIIGNRIRRGNTRSVTVKKNIILSLCIKAVSIIVSLLLVPITLGYVSSEMYGIWLTLSSIVVWMQFFDIGFTHGLKNRLTESIACNNWERGKALVSTTYGMMILIFVPLCLILCLIIPYIDWAWCLNVDAKYNNEIAKAMYVLVACFCLQMILNVLVAVIAAYQRVALSQIFTVIGNAIAIVMICILTKCCPPSLMALGFAISAMPVIVVTIASFYFYNNSLVNVSPSISCFKKEYIKDLFKLGSKFFIIQIQVLVLFQSTNILISNVSSPEDVTSYNIAYKYLGVIMMTLSLLITPLWPAFTDAYTKNEFDWMNHMYKKLCGIYVVCAFAIIMMVIISPLVYSIWVGNKAQVPLSMTIIVAIYMMIHCWDSIQVNLINGIGAIKLQTYVTLVGTVIHIPLSLFFSQYIGAMGVVLSMAIIVSIYSTFFTIQIRKLINNKATGIWKK